MKINQYSVYWTDLNPTQGAEMSKTRPCVVISPDEMNHFLKTVMVAPVTNACREDYPTRTFVECGAITGWIVLDQIRTIDKNQLKSKIGNLTIKEHRSIKAIIQEMLVD